ncbi:MAG: polymer-forming cytoskeletal protein [Spirochaetales bacterium]|nr:polymer-forming cytoskeletal protein [Spirochaetales bacterium]
MAEQFDEQGVLINSLVGDGTSFKGDLVLSGLLRIDGDFSGTIKTPGKVLIGKKGRVESTIIAGSVVIGGVVKGNIVAAEKVVILSSGLFIGNVTTPRLIVEDGVIMHGMCRIDKRNIPKQVEDSGIFSEKRGAKELWKR